MNNGVKIFSSNGYQFKKLVSSRVIKNVIVARIGTSTHIVPLADDVKLARIGDFRGVTASNEKKIIKSPDIILSKMQENLRKNYRISGEAILLGVVRQLEEGNSDLLNSIIRSPERWIPLLILSCGHPLSNIDKVSRTEILNRLWKQLSDKVTPMPIYAWNAKLQVLNENEIDWDPIGTLESIERENVEPDITTFHHVVNRIAASGNVEGCRNMVYNMARKGFAVDATINAASVFMFSLRGHYQKADSLCEQAAVKYGVEGSKMAYGAAVRGAACRGDNDRLRQVLRKSVNVETKKLIISSEDVLEAIWQMAEKSLDGTGSECSQLVDQMLNCTLRDSGFFRKLFREIERHISHRHYYTALSLLEDTKRVSDCLENQQRNIFLEQLVGRLSTQLIRNQESPHMIRDITNRVHYTFNVKHSRTKIRMYDNLLFAALMLKDMDLEKRMEYFRSFVDEIDTRRERIHITLPLLTSEEELDQRLSILYRLSHIGYTDWSKIDIEPFVNAVLLPLYNAGRPSRDQSKMDKVARVLKSYGISDRHVWLLLFNWSKVKSKSESKYPEEQWIRPYSKDLRGWCRAYYDETFQNPRSQPTAVKIPYEKLKACVDQGDVAKVTAILTNSECGGWPADTNFEEIVPSVISMYLNHENWKNVKTMLTELSSHSSSWSDDALKTPVKNFHLINILRRLAEEESTDSIRDITDYAYELRTLFPNSTCYYEGFFETQNEYKKLFTKCFDILQRKKMTPSSLDELIDFLRCLVKLDLIQLHPSETLTVFFINIILKKMGWNDALNTWQKFLSSLHCANGTVALIRYCLQQNTDEFKKNMQFVIHRGSTFLSQSKIAAMHIAVLIGMRRFEEAEKACDLYTKIEPSDCLMAMRLMNSLKSRSLDEQFMLDFAAICFRRLNLGVDKEAAQSMQADLLRICDTRHMGPTALRVYDLFLEHNIELGPDQKNRLIAAIEKHHSLSQKWILKPHGFLNIAADDKIITESEESRIENKLKSDSI